MKEILKTQVTRVYSRRELLRLLGFEPKPNSRMVIEVHNDNVTVIQEDLEEVRPT